MYKKESRKLPVIRILMLALILLCIGSVSPLFSAAVKIMCLGDSITGSPGCWRALLWQKLVNSGYTNIDFVGTLPPQGCGFTYDGENEGHGGILATNMADQSQLPPWLSATSPDIVMMHLGTNDCWSNRATATILAAFTTLVNQMRANNPNMKILVAQIIPMNPSDCSACGQRVIDLNAAIPSWASGLSTSQSPIVVVDQWTGFNTATDTTDGVHPNDAGNVKICDKWYPSLTAFLSVSPGITPDPTNPPADTPSPTNPPSDTAAPTATPGPTAIPTATPAGTPIPTNPPADTSAPADTTAPTNPPTDTVAPTNPPATGCTCTNLCSSQTSITVPFTKDGAGEFCYVSSSLGTYVNSWNCDSVNINGVNCTNTYVASSSIAAIGGSYYIYYKGSYSWSHMEIK
jgi:lysophospholipase L1-like esterase